MSKNYIFPKGLTHGFGPKMPIFPTFFFRKYKPGKCLLWYSRAKKAFLGYKNEKFKKSKNWHFFKWVNPWFLSKNGYFSNFSFLGNIGQENVFYDVLERKDAFLGYKKRSSKSGKIDIFPNGFNPWFWSKSGHFSNFFFFRKYRPRKCLLWYSRVEKNLSRL